MKSQIICSPAITLGPFSTLILILAVRNRSAKPEGLRSTVSRGMVPAIDSSMHNQQDAASDEPAPVVAGLTPGPFLTLLLSLAAGQFSANRTSERNSLLPPGAVLAARCISR